MSGRNRPRQSFNSEDIGDEQQLWTSIVEKIKRCSANNKKIQEIKAKITVAEQAIRDDDACPETGQRLEQLEKLNREGVRLAEEELKILNDDPDDLLRNLETLISVRQAFEAETPRVTVPVKRGTNKRRHDGEVGIDSPAPASETLSPASAPRKGASRSGSVAAASGKSEVQSDSDNVKPAVAAGTKEAKFALGSDVFYRYKGTNSDGLGFLARVVALPTEKTSKRYKVRDIEPDNEDTQGKLALASELMAIPPAGTVLPPLAKNKSVYAVYPNTTTIYNAVVISCKKDSCKLVFENDDEQVNEVERRYVLDPDNA